MTTARIYSTHLYSDLSEYLSDVVWGHELKVEAPWAHGLIQNIKIPDNFLSTLPTDFYKDWRLSLRNVISTILRTCQRSADEELGVHGVINCFCVPPSNAQPYPRAWLLFHFYVTSRTVLINKQFSADNPIGKYNASFYCGIPIDEGNISIDQLFETHASAIDKTRRSKLVIFKVGGSTSIQEMGYKNDEFIVMSFRTFGQMGLTKFRLALEDPSSFLYNHTLMTFLAYGDGLHWWNRWKVNRWSKKDLGHELSIEVM